MSYIYLAEYKFHDGEANITFNIIYVNSKRKEIQVAVTNRGRISVVAYDLFENAKGFYFEYGCEHKKIYINDFKEVV